MHPMRLFGLIGPIGTREAPKGQAIFAQVLAPTTHEARIAFYKDSFRIPDTSKISLEHPYQIVELGGLLLPYVKQMVPYQVIRERIHH